MSRTAQPALPIVLPPVPMPHPSGQGFLPQWVADEIRAGHPNRFMAAARFTTCQKCAALILTGLDDPAFLAGNAAVDPTPLTPQQELACSLTGRATYRAHVSPGRITLTPRDRWNLVHPAGAPGQPPVVPAHLCRARFPSFIIAATSPKGTHENEQAPPPF